MSVVTKKSAAAFAQLAVVGNHPVQDRIGNANGLEDGFPLTVQLVTELWRIRGLRLLWDEDEKCSGRGGHRSAFIVVV